MRTLLDDLDREFALLHEGSCGLVHRLLPQRLYWRPGDGKALSAGENILRSAAVIEQTFGGITSTLNTYKDTPEVAASRTVTFVTTSLRDLLARVGAPPFIHYMSLDIEGAELDALKGFPFDRHRLGALTVEHNFEEPKRSDIEKLMKRQGYRRVHSWQQDDFYAPVRTK